MIKAKLTNQHYHLTQQAGQDLDKKSKPIIDWTVAGQKSIARTSIEWVYGNPSTWGTEPTSLAT